ncbi:major facilitator superfamily domain-containing protein [Truncatella angustata]|uniref:Major facilitator superfamily domain-containing protein n=1 Tax=Truncatella angustata TaxID=152316 RepID=A0A9P8ZWM1_9PEZI|nr:major facilitator superfamily domain-containing protein [Truncatella angustata]KAH6653176.1 major facilitator superfamily domain-containing protein [Truncatella angustata]
MMDSIDNKPTSQELEMAIEPDTSKAVLPAIIVTNKQQAHIRRKFDRHMLPVVCILYVLSYLDRGNIGNAKTSGMMTDLSLSDNDWVWILQTFYICYVLFEWTQLFWKILPAHIYVAVLCFLWGTVAMATGATKNLGGVIACRAFLGIFEAAFGAGAPYFLSLFYQRRELGKRVAILTGMSPLANCFAATLAYGILHIQGSIEPWRLLFIIEGAPTVAFSFVVYFFLPDSPSSARFLSEEEQGNSLTRLETVDRTSKSKVSWSQITAGLTDYQNYVHTLIHFGCNYSFASLSNFLPTIVKDMGYSSLNTQGVIAPAYLTAFMCCVGAAWFSDKYGKRGYVVAGFASIGTVGYLLLAVIQDGRHVGVRYAAIYLACCGMFPALSINMTWLLNNQGGDSKRGAGLALLATFGQCSSFVGSALFPSTDSPFYVRGCATGCALSGMIVILALGLHFKLKSENRKRDRLYGPVDANTAVDVTIGGDKSTAFRYLT